MTNPFGPADYFFPEESGYDPRNYDPRPYDESEDDTADWNYMIGGSDDETEGE